VGASARAALRGGDSGALPQLSVQLPCKASLVAFGCRYTTRGRIGIASHSGAWFSAHQRGDTGHHARAAAGRVPVEARHHQWSTYVVRGRKEMPGRPIGGKLATAFSARWTGMDSCGGTCSSGAGERDTRLAGRPGRSRSAWRWGKANMCRGSAPTGTSHCSSPWPIFIASCCRASWTHASNRNIRKRR
jgi:hypothetical protein